MKQSAKTLTILNFAVVAYFLLIYSLYHLNIELVIIGVIREMATLPALLLQLALVVLGIIYLWKPPRKKLTVISIWSVMVCSVLTMGSIFELF